MEEILFVLNPVAASGNALEVEPIIVEEMKKYKNKYKLILTRRPMEAIEIVERSKAEKIIAVGGDGTINEVSIGIINRGFGTLGIVPAGSGNDLTRSLDIPTDIRAAINKAVTGKPKKLNVCSANGRPYLNIASIGFDAEVVDYAAYLKKRFKGELAYSLSVLYNLFKFKKYDVNIKIDNKTKNSDMVLLAVGNGSYYGGGFQIMPQSDLADGYLHSCLIEDIGKLKLIALSPSILKAEHLKYTDYVSTHKSKKIVIESEKELFFNLDGEILDGGKKIVFKVEDYQIDVIY